MGRDRRSAKTIRPFGASTGFIFISFPEFEIYKKERNFRSLRKICVVVQFYLDMEFVILFASQGRYLSRNLHQVMKNVIARAIEAVQANNIDPYR